MNTKSSEISSGLVAVAWLAPSNYEWPSHFISLTEIRNGEALVRLSDAEAIISDLQNLVTAENQRKQLLEQEVAAKDAEIERLNAALDAKITICGDETIRQQAERIAELAETYDQAGRTVQDYGRIISQTELRLHEVAAHCANVEQQLDKQSAALKLAIDALGKLSLYVAYNGDDWVKRNATDALAAIDALGE